MPNLVVGLSVDAASADDASNLGGVRKAKVSFDAGCVTFRKSILTSTLRRRPHPSHPNTQTLCIMFVGLLQTKLNAAR